MLPDILKEEIASLQEAGYQIQHSIVGNRIIIVFNDYELPVGVFNQQKTDLLVWTTSTYPMTAFDMFWTDEKLLLENSCVPKGAGVLENFLNKNWRRFSIHPYQSKRWNPVEDNLASYLVYINQRLNSKL